MQIRIDPPSLAEASRLLRGSAAGLLADVDEFAAAAPTAAAAVGRAAYPETAATIRAAIRAGGALAADLHRLAAALSHLACAYPEWDRRLLPPEPR